MQGLVSRIHCVLLCARQSSCQTIFYKSSESKCFLYKYPMLERTPVNPETGIDVYEMQGMLYPLRQRLKNDKGNKYYIIQETVLTVIALIKKWSVLRNVYVCFLFVLWFFVPLENFSLILSHHKYRCKSCKFQRYALHSWPFCSEGSLACHTYCDTGHPFKMVIYEDP